MNVAFLCAIGSLHALPQSQMVMAFQPAWRLEIEMTALGRPRTVSLDFAERGTIEGQLPQLALRGRTAFGTLLEFTNETGETLAVVASAYVSHAVRAL